MPKVFVVDDDEAARDSLCLLVRSVGLEVETHDSAQSFLDAFDPTQPGCVLLDIRMPGMSGLDLLSRLRGEGALIPIIIITGHGDVPMAVRALKAGAIDFLEKPFNDQVMLDCVHHALERDVQGRREEGVRLEVESSYAGLTPREKEVMALVVIGNANKQIAEQLSISIKTVETHRANIMDKMGASSVSHLVRMSMVVQSDQVTVAE